jgi:hypothetical protein
MVCAARSPHRRSRLHSAAPPVPTRAWRSTTPGSIVPLRAYLMPSALQSASAVPSSLPLSRGSSWCGLLAHVTILTSQLAPPLRSDLAASYRQIHAPAVVGRELGAVGDLQGLKSYVSNILEHTLAKPEILRGSATDKATACVQPSLRSSPTPPPLRALPNFVSTLASIGDGGSGGAGRE